LNISPVRWLLTLFLLLAVWLGESRGFAASARRQSGKVPERATIREAMQVLRTECFACHNEEKKKGGLVLTSRAALIKGGDEGAVVVPGNPDSSRLARALLPDADPHMPPKKQLSDAQINVLRRWIKQGLVWDAKALEDDEVEIAPVQLKRLPASYQPVMALALSPKGNRLAIGRGSSVFVHDTVRTNYPALAELKAHRDAVQAVAWSGDGRWLVSGAFRRLVLWDAESFRLEREWTQGLLGRVTAAEFAPDRKQLAVADGVMGQSGYVRLIGIEDGRITASWRAHEDSVFDLEFSRDGKQLATAGGDKLIKVWAVDHGVGITEHGSAVSELPKESARMEGHIAPVLSVAFNTNATQLVSAGADKQLKVWDIKTREKIISLGNHSAAITAVVIVAATDSGGAFSYRNLKPHTGEQSSASGDEKKLGQADDALLCVAATPDGKSIFAGSHDGVVNVWDADGKLVAKLPPPINAVMGDAPGSDDRLRDPQTAIPKGRDFADSIRNPQLVRGSSHWPSSIERLTSLAAEPKEIRLSPDAPGHGVLISARTAEGFELDVTGDVKFRASRRAPFEVGAHGKIRALRPGDGVLIAQLGARRVEVPVRVEGRNTVSRLPLQVGGSPSPHPSAPLATSERVSEGREQGNQADALVPPPVSFLRDILPALSKAGCNAGACHAKADGQNGFKLSVFSYDPQTDYAEIIKDARGRRVFPAAPDESLIIRKPTTALPHEGGLRFKRGSETHRLLVRWLREGMAYTVTNEPALQRLAVFPKERRYLKAARQRLLVQAHYSDGSIRDVTRLAAFDSNDKEIATVNEEGLVTVGTLSGQGVVVARYMGFVADAQIMVSADRLLPEAQYAALPRNNFIDDLTYAQFQRLGLLPSELCTDAEFVRRASLDAIGVLPTAEEVREFLDTAAVEEAGQKVRKPESENGGSSPLLTFPPAHLRSAARRALIDRLLARPEYADYWANKWADLLRPNPDRVGVKSVFTLDQWLRESFRQNKPYDRLVREILLAEGTNHRDGPAVIYRDRREPADLTTMFSQLFLGTRLECARCHHHPNEKWSQDDFYGFAAFFGSVRQKGAGLSPPISAGTETFYFASGGAVKHPVTHAVMKPRPPDGSPAEIPRETDPRRALVDWLLAPDNPYFARAAVNRVWAGFFGRGLVEPVDDFRITNPCVNPPLLDALADDFVKHRYDLKHLMRTIMESRLYQLSSTPNETNLADTRNFSRAYRRRLPAEVLLDAVNDATGVPDTFGATPAGARATQVWSYKIESQFMDAFNRPNPSSDPPCERDKDLSVVQSLHLMNSKALQAKLSNESGRARMLADGDKSPEEIVTELYLATLSRPPTGEELQIATSAFNAPEATRRTATEDVFWALLNSAEFVLNH
jgi:WD40 repeat protein